jgi:hypothetical protein
MAILRSDLPSIDSAATSTAGNLDKLRQLILGHQHKLEENTQQSGLDAQKYAANKDADVSAKEQEQSNAIEAVKQMADSGMANDGGSITVNGVGFGKGYDPNKAIATNNRISDQAIKDTTNNYNKGLPKIQDQFNAASEGLQFVNDPRNVGSLGQARTLALKSMGMNRYNEQEAKAVVPPALQGTISQLFNSAGGDETPLNESQKRALNTFFMSTADQAHQKHELLKNNTIGGYQQRNGYDPNKAEGLKNAVMHNFDQQYEDKMKGFANLPTTTSPEADRPAPTGAIDKLAAFFSGGNKKATQPSSTLSPQERQRLEQLRAKRNAAK